MTIETLAGQNCSLSNSSAPTTAIAPVALQTVKLAGFARRPRPTILMVDDEKLNSFVVAQYLKKSGHSDLLHTDDPRQALAIAERERPDVILLDLRMPKLGGLQFLRQLRAHPTLAESVVVILTASTDQAERAEAIALGAVNFLQKPIQKAELLACLQDILPARST